MATNCVQHGIVLGPITAAADSAPPASTRGGTRGKKTFQAKLSGTGVISATVPVQGSFDPSDANGWSDLGSIDCAGSGNASAFLTTDDMFPFHRVRCTAIAGTGATLTVYCGEEPH